MSRAPRRAAGVRGPPPTGRCAVPSPPWPAWTTSIARRSVPAFSRMCLRYVEREASRRGRALPRDGGSHACPRWGAGGPCRCPSSAPIGGEARRWRAAGMWGARGSRGLWGAVPPPLFLTGGGQCQLCLQPGKAGRAGALRRGSKRGSAGGCRSSGEVSGNPAPRTPVKSLQTRHLPRPGCAGCREFGQRFQPVRGGPALLCLLQPALGRKIGAHGRLVKVTGSGRGV